MKVTENDDKHVSEGRVNDIDGVGRMACWENKKGL